MNIHKNARLTLAMRADVVACARQPHGNMSALARAFRVSRQTIAKWVRRAAIDEGSGLADRSSRPHHSPCRLSRVRRRQVERRRRRRWSSIRIARDLGVPIATVVREHRRLGLNQLRRLDPPRPANRYEWPAAGDMLHLDIKKLARIGRVGYRIHGDRRTKVRWIGWESVHVAIDDATRLGYVEVLDAEDQWVTTASATTTPRAPTWGSTD